MESLEKNTTSPFSLEKLKQDIVKIEEAAEVTSIPTPYARKHLFNFAFFVANGKAATKTDLYKEGTGDILFDQLISYCLDVYELLFYWDEYNLDMKGFKIQNFKIPETKVSNPKHENFRKTLELFYKSYKNKLEVPNGPEFVNGYTIHYKGDIIAITSPFTGFYTPAQSNLPYNEDSKLSGIELTRKLDNKKVTTLYFCDNKDKYRPIGKRDELFQKFMCQFIDKAAPKNYTDFSDYIKNFTKSNKSKLLEKDGNAQQIYLEKFGFTGQEPIDMLKNAVIIPDKTSIEENSIPNYIAIPDRFTKIFFASLIRIKPSVVFNLPDPKTFYKAKADSGARKFLETKGNWVSVDDFLQNDIVELQDPINDKYFYTCEMLDENDVPTDVKVLLPLKKFYFDLFNFNGKTIDEKGNEKEINFKDRIIVRQISKTKYAVTLKIPTQTGVTLLSKEYTDDLSATSRIIKLMGNDSIYLGIYPFVKDITTPTNNGYFRIFTFHSKKVLSSNLTFYKNENSGIKLIEDDNSGKEKHCKEKKFDRDGYNNSIPISTYYSLERYVTSLKDSKDGLQISESKEIDFNIIQMDFEKSISYKKDNEKRTKVFHFETFIIPKFVEKECELTSGYLGVDIGTSNSNISIGSGSGSGDIPIEEYNTVIDNTPSLVMFHKHNNTANDIVNFISNENQLHFLCEFMPVLIGKENSDYKFPIPTILNLHSDQLDKDCVSLLDANIGFEFYVDGLRNNIDDPIGGFKWAKDENQILQLYLFIDQVLLMSRSHLMLKGQNLKGVKVIWTSPLSMAEDLEVVFKSIWEILYQKYFDGAKDNDRKFQNLKYIDESIAPFYASTVEFKTGANISIDIGGGSTDVLLYKDEILDSVTSHYYAGNNLFAGMQNENIFYKKLNSEDKEKQNFQQDVISKRSILQSPKFGVAECYNYLFIKDKAPCFLRNKELKYLLVLHTCAILYHTIQNCKARIPNEEVNKILFSGNGSLLFKRLDLNDNNNLLKELINHIIKFVYQSETNPDIYFVDENWKPGATESVSGMKAATSVGSINWGSMNASRGDIYSFIPFGDSNTTFKAKDFSAKIKEDKNIIIEAINNNFKQFIDNFLGDNDEHDNSVFGYTMYEIFNGEPPINKANVMEIINSKNIVKNSINMAINSSKQQSSLFFEPIKELIIQLSKYFAERN